MFPERPSPRRPGGPERQGAAHVHLLRAESTGGAAWACPHTVLSAPAQCTEAHTRAQRAILRSSYALSPMWVRRHTRHGSCC